ncbi:MAG: hypothetical protein HUK20_14780 [Fibrobacter sp.]|nr:hypothetical protein [Fibrobacter sp.]
MEHEYTICGRIFPRLSQVEDRASLQHFTDEIRQAEKDFLEMGLKIRFTPCNLDEQGSGTKTILALSMESADLDCDKIENACLKLSLILCCTVMLCKYAEGYGVANVFNGGSDFQVVDEECTLWIFEQGVCALKETTKFWNEKFAQREQEFLESETSKRMNGTLLSLPL